MSDGVFRSDRGRDSHCPGRREATQTASRALENIWVVLAGPKEAGNVAACCRAMKSMGLTHLALVEPLRFAPSEVRAEAGNAADVFERISRYESLESAVAPFGLVFGVSRRHGQRRKYVSYEVQRSADMAVSVSAGHVGAAFVFGNETSGLSDSELSACHVVVTIPSWPSCPSLNLSHAAQVVTYELCLAANRFRPAERAPCLTGDEIATLTRGCLTDLHAAGFSTQQGPQGMAVFLRDLFARFSLSREEAGRVRRVFAAFGAGPSPTFMVTQKTRR